MIARHLLLFLILILLPDYYLYRHWLKGQLTKKWKRALLLVILTAGLLVYTAILYFQPDFQPDNALVLEVYLWILGLFVVPKAAFALCSACGHVVKRYTRVRRNYGNLIGLLLALLLMYVTIYGFTIGFRQIVTKHVDLYFDDLPEAFDGYRVALFSDLHVGTYEGRREQILHRAIETIQSQHADLIIFAGDLQNLRPQEVYPHRQLLASLHADDGVVSVMGNHDYAQYIKADSTIATANEQEMLRLQRQMGWQILRNERVVLRRNEKDSIIVVGLDDEGIKAECQRADIQKSMEGIEGQPFTIIVEHEPNAWRSFILDQSHAQLTLSGHTHGGQIAFFGFSPLRLRGGEVEGLYDEQGRYLYVTSGIGGLIPMRFGVPAEVVVITLHRK